MSLWIHGVSYCEKEDFMGGCERYGFSASNGLTIKHMFDLSGEFTWGWNGGDFFISDNSKIYIVDFSKISFN